MRISANGISIEVDDRGSANGTPLLMIMGLGMQLTAWPEELVQALVSRGFRVIRFDNRDIGLSQHFDEHGVPNLAWAAMRWAVHLPVHSPYSLSDMAADAIGVLDALGLEAVHVCGASMGGMIAQRMAAEHGSRVRSLSLMMTTSGARRLPQAATRVRRAMMSRPASGAPEDVVAHLQSLLGVIGSPAYATEPERMRQRLSDLVRRSWHPAGTARQLMAVIADGDRTPLLSRIAVPTCVIHGEDDPLVPVAAGRDLVQRIRGAIGDFVPGMGHDLPLQLLPRFADGIAGNARRG